LRVECYRLRVAVEGWGLRVASVRAEVHRAFTFL
jgi:hypothetical protein